MNYGKVKDLYLNILTLAAFALLLCGGVAYGGAVDEAVPSDGVSVEGKALYMHWCAQCHGLEGRGDGVNSTLDMSINPRDHTDPTFMSTRSNEQFAEIILGGGTRGAKSPLMPPWEATLSKEEVDLMVVYLRELCDCEYEGVVSHNKLRRVDVDFR